MSRARFSLLDIEDDGLDVVEDEVIGVEDKVEDMVLDVEVLNVLDVEDVVLTSSSISTTLRTSTSRKLPSTSRTSSSMSSTSSPSMSRKIGRAHV